MQSRVLADKGPEGASPLGLWAKMRRKQDVYCRLQFIKSLSCWGNKQFLLYYPHCNANDLFSLDSTSPEAGAYPAAAAGSVSIFHSVSLRLALFTFPQLHFSQKPYEIDMLMATSP